MPRVLFIVNNTVLITLLSSVHDSHRFAYSQSMSRYRSAPFFLVFQTGPELGPRAGIISGHTSPISQIISGHTSPFCRRSTDLVLICGKSHAVLRGTSSDYGSWSNWAYYSLDSRGLCLGHSVLPLPCENRRLSMGLVAR